MEMTVTVGQLIEDAIRFKLRPLYRGFGLPITVTGRIVQDGLGSGKLCYIAQLRLSAGLIEVPLDLSDGRAAWLLDGELLREVDKAVQAFRVAIALDGEPQRVRNVHPTLYGTSRGYGEVGPFLFLPGELKEKEHA